MHLWSPGFFWRMRFGPWSPSGSPNNSSGLRQPNPDSWPVTTSERDKGEIGEQRHRQPYSRPTVPDCFSSDGKPQAFQHPVRLFWPKSKSFDYLYSDGEALLRNFPIQATISFYEESDSEDEDEEDWEEDGNSEECLKHKSHFTSYN
eukprot:superscaffoldBa00001716_g11740